LRHFDADKLARPALTISPLAPRVQVRAPECALERRRGPSDLLAMMRLRTGGPAIPLPALALRADEDDAPTMRTI
jgi:hypothetical protein